MSARLESVLRVIYLIFNEGYSATSGDDWVRPELCEDALRLARILQGILPTEPDVFALAALLELQASRLRARTGPDGAPILLLDQNRSKWDHVLIRRGYAALRRACELGGGGSALALQAAIAMAHASARTADATNWSNIAALYGELARVAPSPVVLLNRGVAVGMAEGPAAGLLIIDALRDEPALASYHLLPAVRADLLIKLGRHQEAHAELLRAASLTKNARERALLLDRAAACERSAIAAGTGLC